MNLYHRGAVEYSFRDRRSLAREHPNPIEHGIFWFNGFLSLKPFIAFQPARLSHDERTSYLRALGERLQHIEGEQPRTGDDGGSG